MAAYLFTYSDAINHCVRFLQRREVPNFNPAQDQGDIRRCIQQAHREVAQRRAWAFLHKQGRIQLNATYSTGTVVYDYTGGAYERMLTLTTGTWPTWSASGTVRIDGVNHMVAERKSSSVITLDSVLCPNADISSTTYDIFQTAYSLPDDFVRMASPQAEDTWYGASWVSPEDWHSMERQDFQTGKVDSYTIARRNDSTGVLAALVYPAPDTAETWDYVYHSRPRQLVIAGYGENDCVGTVTVGSGSASVTGSQTAFSSSMIGSVMRFSSGGQTLPTNVDGFNPRAEEHMILSVTSATALTLATSTSQALTAVKYSISDPVNLDQAMTTLFLRCCEKHLAISFNLKDHSRIENAYAEAYTLATEADSRGMHVRVAGSYEVFPQRYTVDFSGDTYG